MKDIEEQVCKDILERQRVGIAKYLTTVADNPLSILEWHTHHYEELLDAAVYTKRIIEQLKEGKQ